MKRFLNLVVLSCFIFTNAFAAGVPFKPQADEIQLGKDGSTADKKITVNVGDGASNPKIEVDAVTKKFEFSKGLEVTGAVNATGALSGTSVTGSGALAIGGNAVVTGDLTVTGADINIGAGTNKLRANGGFLEFSNDGSLYKKIGSGSGGDSGVNILENVSFEDGLTPGWTSSGGTFSQESYTDSVENDLKYAKLIASGASQYFETSLKAIPTFGTGGCLGKINYQTTDAANWKIQIYDSSANLLAEQTLVAKEWQNGYASFPCPTVGTTVKMRVISLAAGTIKADKGYLGLENRTFQVAQSKLAGSAYYAGTASCQWAVTSVPYADYATDVDCPAPTIVSSSMGTWSTTDANLPQFTIASLPAGRYVGVAKYTVSPGSTGATFCSRITDGTTNGQGSCSYASGAATAQTHTSTIDVTYTVKGDRTFKIQGRTNTTDIQLINTGVNGDGVEFFLYYYPTDSQTALVPEAQDWIIDANIGGSTNPATTSITTPVAYNATTMDLVLNTGSASAKIPCTGGNAPTGLTCSAGNEVFGLSFTNPQAGWFEVCADLTMNTNGTQSTNEWMEWTSPTSSTVIQLGKSRVASHMSAGTNYQTQRNCGTFYFSDVKERVIALHYEANGTANTLLLDRDATLGQRDAHIIVRPLLSSFNRPYLTGDQMTTPSMVNPKFFSAFVTDGASTTTLSRNYGSMFSGCTNGSAGVYVCSFSSTRISIPNCDCESANLDDDYQCNAYSETTSQVSIHANIMTSGALADTNFKIFCHGD